MATETPEGEPANKRQKKSSSGESEEETDGDGDTKAPAAAAAAVAEPISSVDAKTEETDDEGQPEN